jgi:hypothetical protein
LLGGAGLDPHPGLSKEDQAFCSWTLAGTPLEKASARSSLNDDTVLVDPGRSIVPDISRDNGNLLDWYAMVGLPDMTRFNSGGRSLSFSGIGTAEAWVIWLGNLWSEYCESELRSEPSYVVRFEPNPRIFIALPPDQYLFHPDDLLVLPRLPPLVLPRALGVGVGSSAAPNDTPLSCRAGPALMVIWSCGIGLLMAVLYFLLNWLLESLPKLPFPLSPPLLWPYRPINIAIDENDPCEDWGSWPRYCLAELICGYPLSAKSIPSFSFGIPLDRLWWPASLYCLRLLLHLIKANKAISKMATNNIDPMTAPRILTGNGESPTLGAPVEDALWLALEAVVEGVVEAVPTPWTVAAFEEPSTDVALAQQLSLALKIHRTSTSFPPAMTTVPLWSAHTVYDVLVLEGANVSLYTGQSATVRLPLSSNVADLSSKEVSTALASTIGRAFWTGFPSASTNTVLFTPFGDTVMSKV